LELRKFSVPLKLLKPPNIRGHCRFWKYRGPIGSYHIADIHVAMRIERYRMRRNELARLSTRTFAPINPGNDATRLVNECHSRA
jgi:hypothetical protein